MRVVLIIILTGLLSLLWYELFYFKQGEQPSTLVNQSVPPFSLIDLMNAPQVFDEKNLKGRVSLLNVWATWCDACKLEHEMLMKIKNEYQIPIYGINYKDDPQAVLIWLSTMGNPYTKLGLDQDGKTAIDFGIYGTPETFIVNAEGKIIYRHIGIINQLNWDTVLYPIIKQWRA